MSGFAPVTLGRIGSTFTLGELRLTETFHAGGSSLPLHDHEDFTVNVVLQGIVEERVGRRTHTCRPGTLLTKPAGQNHANRYFGEVIRCVVVQLSNGFAEPGWTARVNLERVMCRRGMAILESARRLAAVFHQGAFDADLLALTETWNLLSHCVPTRPKAIPARWIKEVRDVLTEHAQAPGRLGSLATRMGVPLWVLSRAFERTYGVSPTQYRRRVRLQSVAQQLRETEVPISSLAHSAGFADHSHLVRWFCRAYGCTPSQYRARSRASPF